MATDTIRLSEEQLEALKRLRDRYLPVAKASGQTKITYGQAIFLAEKELAEKSNA